MEIYPLGHSSFRLKGKTATVVTDPFDSAAVTLKFPKLDTVDIVTVSHQHPDHNALSAISNHPFVITSPGEYEVKGVTVVGTSTFHDDKNGAERGPNTVYNLTIDFVRVCHLGDLGHKLTDAQLERIEDVDVLLIPVGGFYTINYQTAAQVVTQLEPRIVVPMHYNRPQLRQETFGKIDPVDKFLKEMGVEGVAATPQAKLVTSKEKLPETTTVVVLEA